MLSLVRKKGNSWLHAWVKTANCACSGPSISPCLTKRLLVLNMYRKLLHLLKELLHTCIVTRRELSFMRLVKTQANASLRASMWNLLIRGVCCNGCTPLLSLHQSRCCLVVSTSLHGLRLALHKAQVLVNSVPVSTAVSECTATRDDDRK